MIHTGKEDRKRVASYKARKQINLEQKSAVSIEDFLRGLKMQLFVQPLDDTNLARASQLCQKTNQFNTTTVRYAPRDLESMAAGAADVAVIGLSDKFTERENIGLIVLSPQHDAQNGGTGGRIDLFLLSCRVLGRTIERAVLDWAVTRAHGRGWATLMGPIVQTPRNSPARGVFADNGFAPGPAEGLWQRETAPAQVQDWFVLHDSFTKN
jgi:FkbH-like protein